MTNYILWIDKMQFVTTNDDIDSVHINIIYYYGISVFVLMLI